MALGALRERQCNKHLAAAVFGVAAEPGVFQRARLFVGWMARFRCVHVSMAVGCECVYVYVYVYVYATHCQLAVAAERAF